MAFMVELQPVESQAIAAVGYDKVTQTLVVLFNSGRAYEYYQVTPEEYRDLLAAGSKGRYVNNVIKKSRPYAPFRGWKKPEGEAEQIEP